MLEPVVQPLTKNAMRSEDHIKELSRENKSSEQEDIHGNRVSRGSEITGAAGEDQQRQESEKEHHARESRGLPSEGDVDISAPTNQHQRPWPSLDRGPLFPPLL